MKAKKSRLQQLKSSHLSEPRKNLLFTKPAEALKLFEQKPLLFRLVKVGLFLIYWAILSYIFYLRFPNNYRQPNFFGEEGNIFAENIIRHGFLHALGTTFNGYYIWGIYALEKIAFIINSLFYNGEFVNLARSFAITSYSFFGLIATLPILLLRRYFRLPVLILTTLFILFVPLGGWDYGVLGTVGNAKFALIFVAFLLLIYRNLLPERSKKIYLVDIILLVCAYTNITVYIMLPFALLRYWPKLKGGKYGKKLLVLIRNDHTFQSLILLGLALLPQLYVIKTRGVPPLPGYLDNAFNFRRVIEIFVSRSFLYEFLFPVNKYLSDVLVILIFIITTGLLWLFAKKQRAITAFGIFTIFMATLLFVIKRTGISDFFIGYKDAGPSQFFFPQNWVFGFLGSFLIVALVDKLKQRRVRIGIYLMLFAGFIIFLRPYAGTYGKNDFEEREVGNIYINAKKACAGSGDNLSISVYPAVALKYNDLPRQRLCTPTAVNYHPEVVDLGLKPFENHYLTELGGNNFFSQTFVSPEDNLNGVSIYFSTFLRHVHTPYQFELFSGDCVTEIKVVSLATSKIDDNSFFLITFPYIHDSKNKTYCFNINSSSRKDGPRDPLAVQLSKPGIYPEGSTLINGALVQNDIVFKLHYRN